jgi:hypothetical protein
MVFGGKGTPAELKSKHVVFSNFLTASNRDPAMKTRILILSKVQKVKRQELKISDFCVYAGVTGTTAE